MRKNLLRPAVAGILTLAALGSCTRRIYIPIENTHTWHDTLQSHAVRADTLRLLDSVIIDRNGDAVRERVVRERWHKSLLHDTLYLSRHDTLTQTKEIPVPIEIRPGIKQRAGNAALWLVVGAVSAIVVRRILRRRKAL